ncbi:MAG: RNA methyltransferase [Pseudomonadota bacterium]
MTETKKLDNITIVLHRPRYPENIGAAVRAGYNMGITKVCVVEPADYDKNKILKMATHSLADGVENIRQYNNLKEALAPFQYIVGTTARLGKHRHNLTNPKQIAKKIASLSDQIPIAVLFGPEDRGLTNEDLQYCHSFVNIPTASFSSLNLAQAVMVICYELFTAQKTEAPKYIPRLATRHELDGMYHQLQEILTKINFLNPHNPEYWMNNIRSFFSRLELRAKEVSIIRGICRQVSWYAEKRFQDGLDDQND